MSDTRNLLVCPETTILDQGKSRSGTERFLVWLGITSLNQGKTRSDTETFLVCLETSNWMRKKLAVIRKLS